MRTSDIRDYRREEFDALAALYQRGKGDEFRFEPGWPERFSVIPLSCDEVRLKAFGDARVLVVPAREGSASNGAVDETLDGAIYWKEGHIVGLLVAPGSRGKGLGRSLVMAALDRMVGAVTLDVVASNAPAIRLYESLGFQRVDQRVGRYQGVPVTVSVMRRGQPGHA